ncbi:MAG: TIGR00730 family Rossman fold protein [Clostridiales bacterium]|nr:TIGR00730 family Rossman fold protein [Clostridiales bacterium]
MSRSICVYSSSSQWLEQKYYDYAEELGSRIGKNGDTLVFGAGSKGLMGATARGAKAFGAKVIGVIPEALNLPGVPFEECDELTVTPDMRSRKKLLDESADVLVALPGGFGTLEELLEVITSKQLGYHSKPIVILNPFGYYDALLEQFEHSFELNFADRSYSKLYYVTDDIDDMFRFLEGYNFTARSAKEKYEHE